MGVPLKVLMVEDSEDDSELLVHELRRGGFDLSWTRVETEDALRAALEDDAWDVITSDYNMPRLSAPKALAVLKESGRDLPFIVVSGVISMERAVDLMRAGADDFVEKNDLARLVPAIERGLRGAAAHRGRKRAEGLLQDAIEYMADGFGLCDAGDRFVHCNENYRNSMSGIDDTLVPGTPFEDMAKVFAERGLIAVEADQIDDWVRTRIAQHRAAEGFHEHQFADGRWIRTAERRTSDGGLVCIRADITERKRAEAALRESEEGYRDLIEGAVQGIVIDSNRKPLFANQVYADIFGYESAEEIVALKSLQTLYAPHERRRVREYRRARMRGEAAPSHYEFEGVKKDGSHIWLETRLRVITWQGKAATQSNVTDITERKRTEEKLRKSEELLRGAVDSLQEGFALYDADDRLVLFNDEYRRLHPDTQNMIKPGLRYEDLLRANVANEANADALGREEEFIRDRLERHRNPKGPIERRLTSGVTFIIKESRTRDGGITVTLTDITEQKRAEEALRESEERYRTLHEKTPVMVHSIDRDARLISVSDYWLEILGYERDEVLGRSIVEFYTDEARQYAEEIALPQFFKTGSSEDVPLQIVKKNGDILDILLSATVQYGQEGEFDHSLAVMIDVTERKRAEAHIEHLALHDSLTNLPNRFLFHDRLQNAVAQVKRTDSALALLFLDLDDFKDVNDTLGHAAGDELLKAVAERLKSYLRDSDTVGRHNTTLARLGGDEFTILLTNLSDPVDAATVADRIIEDLSRPFVIGGNVIHTGTCIGIAVYPSHGGTPEELLKKADLALYRSKAEGRNRYHFYSEQMETEILARKDLERDLRAALAEGQLSLVYQPQMDIKSGAMVGMEALLRWNHPERGFISPGEFIPVAEAIGLIVPIGKWVLHQACAQNKAWQEAGLPAFAVAVNLSAVQFRQEDLVATVHGALQKAGLDPAYLHIEITESVFMQDGAREVLLDFRRSGIAISLDDFGTGYSSLSYLTRFPVDKIKLDRSFVRDIAHDTSNAAIIKAVVNLGHSLGMRVNVEGVETGDVLSILRAYGVDEVQGYYYSHPLPADAVAEFLTEITAPSNRVATRA